METFLRHNVESTFTNAQSTDELLEMFTEELVMYVCVMIGRHDNGDAVF